MIRCFICIDLVDMGENVLREIARVQERVSNLKFTGKLIPFEDAHLTLKFLGEIDGKKLEEVKKKLYDIKLKGFECELENIGMFDFRGNPRIVWIKIGGEGILKLQNRIDEILEPIGFEKEQRFMSHATIARIKYVKDKIGFRKHVAGIGLKDIRFEVDRFKLKTSELRALGPVYRDVENYILEDNNDYK